MSGQDLDQLHRNRVRETAKKFGDADFELDHLFLSEKVVEALDVEKVLIDGLNFTYLLAVLPFSPQVFLQTCGGCFSNDSDVDNYIALLKEDLFVPVLTAPYRTYPPRVVEAVLKKGHISVYEFITWYNLTLPMMADGQLCPHCIDKHKVEVTAPLKGVRGISDARQSIKAIFSLLTPYVAPDYTLLKAVKDAVDPIDIETVSQLEGIARFIRMLRTAQVWNGSVPLAASAITSLPSELKKLTGDSPFIAAALREQVADGLGLRVPMDVPIARYAELVREYRPRILRVMGKVIPRNDLSKKSFAAVAKEVARINDEIDRIKNLRRYVMIEAAFEVFGNHKPLVASGLALGALGFPAGGIPGCLVGASVGAAGARVGKAIKKRLTKEPSGEGGPRLKKAATVIHSDIQPVVETVMSIYLNSDAPSIGVMSLREEIAARQ